MRPADTDLDHRIERGAAVGLDAAQMVACLPAQTDEDARPVQARPRPQVKDRQQG